jgi:hypothetical protein
VILSLYRSTVAGIVARLRKKYWVKDECKKLARAAAKEITPERRASIKNSLESGMGFEEWRERFLKDNPEIRASQARLKADGIPADVVLRAWYDEATQRLVN